VQPLDLLVPPVCAVCRAGPAPVCPACLGSLQLLAGELAARWGLPAAPLLARFGRRRPQRGLDTAGRRANVRGAFRSAAAVPALPVVLVDDVHTTGATLAECARVLCAAGASRVDVVTLARAL
jgi:predicted amidophosphoribosyltransferase